LGALAVVVIVALAFALTRGDGSDDITVTPTTTSGTTTPATSPSTTTTTTASAVTTTQPTATSAPTTVPAGTVFTDGTNVYRVRVPPTWSDATKSGGLQTWTTGTGSSVNVLIEKLPVDITMEDYLAASVRNAPRQLPSFVEVSRSVSTVSGKVLGQLDYRSNQQIPLRHRAVVVIKGRNAIVVTFSAPPERFDTEVASVQPYLTSVEGV
jgi:hypothetical protein